MSTAPTIREKALGLSEADKFKLLDALVKDLGISVDAESLEQRQVRLRKEALEVLLQVSEHLGLAAGEAPTLGQFNMAVGELGLDWNGQKVIRAWGRWRTATETFTGARSTGSAIYREFARNRDRSIKNRQEPIAGIKQWLRSQPTSLTETAYDQYVLIVNRQQEEEQATDPRLRRQGHLRRSQAACRALGLHWPNLLAVARDQTTVSAAREQELAELLPRATSNALLGVPGAVRLLGRSETSIRQAISRSGYFPTPVAIIDRHRAWAYEDLKRYRRGLLPAQRSESELQYDYIDSDELKRRLRIADGPFRRRLLAKRWDLVPRPDGWIARGVPYWQRTKLEDWLRVKGRAEMTPEQEDQQRLEQARQAAAISAGLSMKYGARHRHRGKN